MTQYTIRAYFQDAFSVAVNSRFSVCRPQKNVARRQAKHFLIVSLSQLDANKSAIVFVKSDRTSRHSRILYYPNSTHTKRQDLPQRARKILAVTIHYRKIRRHALYRNHLMPRNKCISQRSRLLYRMCTRDRSLHQNNRFMQRRCSLRI